MVPPASQRKIPEKILQDYTATFLKNSSLEGFHAYDKLFAM